jgi:hypothetical protein
MKQFTFLLFLITLLSLTFTVQSQTIVHNSKDSLIATKKIVQKARVFKTKYKYQWLGVVYPIYQRHNGSYILYKDKYSYKILLSYKDEISLK